MKCTAYKDYLIRAFKTRRQSSVAIFHSTHSVFIVFLSANPQKKRAAITLNIPLRPALRRPSQSPLSSETMMRPDAERRHSGCKLSHHFVNVVWNSAVYL